MSNTKHLRDSEAASYMLTLVTARTERDQVLQRVVAELTARSYMMDLQVFPRAAALTTPAVSL
jgi:hypothetical protein